MADLSQDALNKLKASLKEQADLQQKLTEDTGFYFKLIKDIKNLHNAIAVSMKVQLQKEEQLKKAAADLKKETDKGINANKVLVKELEEKIERETNSLGILKEQIKAIKETTQEYTKQAKEAQTVGHVIAKMNKDITGIGRNIKQSYGKLKELTGSFKDDKAIRMAATQMGLLTSQTDSFRNSLDYAGQQTASFGVGISELANMQADYSNELGRSVMLGQQGLEAMAQMSKATGLGADGAAKMAADFEQQGISAERTRDLIEQTMNDSTKMGINASKVIKNIQSNMKMLNKYNFKGGVKGLTKMAQTVTKLGVNMDFVAGMAEKLFDVEGAVDMSAQLQVMGGAWAKLADPFKLMYMARNDMEGLVEEMGKAAEASVHFNKKSGDFEISAMEMHKLRKIAEQTGVAYDDLATAGKNAAKMTMLKNQIHFKVDKETQELLSNTAKINENGEATIEVKGQPKLLKTLTDVDIKALKVESASLKERAKMSQTFDDQLNNLIMQVKQFLLPFVNVLTNSFGPVVDKLSKTLSNPEVLNGIKSATEWIRKGMKIVGKFIAENPVKSFALALGGFGLMEATKWYLNGLALGKGFNTVASPSKGGSGFGGGMKGIKTGANMIGSGRIMGGLGTMTKGFGKAALPLALLSAGIDGVTNALDNNLSVTDKILKTLDQHKGMAAGAVIGSIVPGIGTAVGAGIGGIVDMFTPEIGNYGKSNGINDGIITRPIHDGKLGGNFNKGRGIIQGGKITPIDNKDDLMAMKPNGPVDRAIKTNNNSSVKVEFGNINFTGEIKLTTSDGKVINTDLLKDPHFIRDVTRMVHAETQKVINGGKVKG